MRYLPAADVCYNLDCWLVRACLLGAKVTRITTSLVCCKSHKWFDTAITPGASVSDIHAWRHKFTDMTVVYEDETVTDMYADSISMPTHISVWGYMYPLVFPFGGTCSFLRVHIF